jgi:3-oxoacyl-[acyl-carrier protein] reductase
MSNITVPEVPVALVTGASRGIGRGIAIELAAAGYAVAVHYRGNHEAACETVSRCPGSNAFAADIGVSEDRGRLVEQVYEHFGKLDVLVNNAGIAPRERNDILHASEESLRELLAVNLEGPYALTQMVSRRWVAEHEQRAASQAETGATPRRSIVFVTSISAVTASINRGEYCVSKAGLAMAASLFSVRLADEGIDVFEVRPGIIKTDMTAGVTAKYDTLLADGLVPQRRWGYPQDIGRAVRALVSGDFAFATGSVIHTDGGFHVQRL